MTLYTSETFICRNCQYVFFFYVCVALSGFQIFKEAPRSVEAFCLKTKLLKKDLEELSETRNIIEWHISALFSAVVLLTEQSLGGLGYREFRFLVWLKLKKKNSKKSKEEFYDINSLKYMHMLLTNAETHTSGHTYFSIQVSDLLKNFKSVEDIFG